MSDWKIHGDWSKFTYATRPSDQFCDCGTFSNGPQHAGWVCDDCKFIYQAQRAQFTPLSSKVMWPWNLSPRQRVDTQPVNLPEFDLNLDDVVPPKDPNRPHVCPARDCGSPALIMSSSVECTNSTCRWYTR